MKKLFLLFVTCSLFSTLRSQTVNNIPLREIQAEYVEMTVIPKAFSSKKNILIDYGQVTGFSLAPKEAALRDSDGKYIDFASPMEALNFIAKNGFELITAFSPPTENSTWRIYLLRNKNFKARAVGE